MAKEFRISAADSLHTRALEANAGTVTICAGIEGFTGPQQVNLGFRFNKSGLGMSGCSPHPTRVIRFRSHPLGMATGHEPVQNRPLPTIFTFKVRSSSTPIRLSRTPFSRRALTRSIDSTPLYIPTSTPALPGHQTRNSPLLDKSQPPKEQFSCHDQWRGPRNTKPKQGG